MFFSGIADEAGVAIETQIKAHQELGWNHIELRNIEGIQFHDVEEEVFESICEKLAAADMKVSCFASAIANWACKITDDFQRDIDILNRAVPRMQKLGSPFIRIMSYENSSLSDDAWRDEAVRRIRELAAIAEAGGVTLVLENCGGWASASAENFSAFFDLVGSSAMKAVYDTGNPAAHGLKNTWDWYQAAKPYIAYVHIKSNTGPTAEGGSGKHVFPDAPESVSRIHDTLTDLFCNGFDGGISIEPHMCAVVHLDKGIDNSEEAYNTYLEYGKRVMAMAEKAKPPACCKGKSCCK